jgi:hypothetical protein
MTFEKRTRMVFTATELDNMVRLPRKIKVNVRPPQKVQVGCSRITVDSRQSEAEDVKRVNPLG